MLTRARTSLVVLATTTLLLEMPAVAGNITSEDDDDCSVPYPHCLDIDDSEVASMETVVGKVEVISDSLLCSRQAAYLTLTLRQVGAADTRDVFLAPTQFLRAHGMTFKVGDEVTVFGISAWNTVRGELTAIQVEKGGAVLTLRGNDGRPLWLSLPPST